jgi:hypothetical protein
VLTALGYSKPLPYKVNRLGREILPDGRVAPVHNTTSPCSNRPSNTAADECESLQGTGITYPARLIVREAPSLWGAVLSGRRPRF